MTDHSEHRGRYFDSCAGCIADPPSAIYMVFREGGDPPMRKYSRRWRADMEQRRLAKANPHARFHVMKIKSTAVASEDGTLSVSYSGKWRPKDERVLHGDPPEITESPVDACAEVPA